MIYNIEDKPKFLPFLGFGCQMLLSVFCATALIAKICSVPISGALFGAGMATIVYLLVTQGKSPMFISNSGAFVAPVLLAISSHGMSGVFVGGIVAAIIYCVCGVIFGQMPNLISKIFPPALVGTITLVIGINLMSFIPTYLEIADAPHIITTLITALTIVVVSLFHGHFQLFALLMGMGVGTITSICFGIFPFFTVNSIFEVPNFAIQNIDFEPIKNYIAIICVYIAYSFSAMMECLSDHKVLSNVVDTNLFEKPGIRRIFIGEGLAQIISTGFGGLNTCSYGESVACIGLSKCASSAVTGLAAIMLVLMSFITPIQQLITAIPNCVFAGCAIVLYGYIALSGLKTLSTTNLNTKKNTFIVAVCLSLGVSGISIGIISGVALAFITGIILNLGIRNNNM